MIIRTVDFAKSGTRREHYPQDMLPQVAFVGRSNVGKSSLLNVLSNRKRLAHVSNTPGRTQLVNFFRVNETLYFVDLPGYGFARAPGNVRKTWERMIVDYLKGNARLRLVMALFDARRTLTDEDNALLDWLGHYQIPFVAVMTKSDKLTRSAQATALRALREAMAAREPVAVHLFSAQTRQGREEVLETIHRVLNPPAETDAADSDAEAGPPAPPTPDAEP